MEVDCILDYGEQVYPNNFWKLTNIVGTQKELGVWNLVESSKQIRALQNAFNVPPLLAIKRSLSDIGVWKCYTLTCLFSLSKETISFKPEQKLTNRLSHAGHHVVAEFVILMNGVVQSGKLLMPVRRKAVHVVNLQVKAEVKE